MALVPNLVRPQDDKVIAGVCSGIARSLGIETSIVRLVVVLSVVFGGLSLWVYPLAWLLMPAEGSSTSGAEKLFQQAREWDAARTPGADRPREVFDPYKEP